jgi:hypothetical protein
VRGRNLGPHVSRQVVGQGQIKQSIYGAPYQASLFKRGDGPGSIHKPKSQAP